MYVLELEPLGVPDIHRHRTAMKRTALSRPIRIAISDGLVSSATGLFDFGCGLGDDLGLLEQLGIAAVGWDPVHRPETPLKGADVVNLGYVVNVIESNQERADVVRRAWALAGRLLVVSARLVNELKDRRFQPYADGYLTKTKTFQKYFEQNELRQWIEETLEQQAVAAAPGVFYVFRDLDWKEEFLASRIRRRPTLERISTTMARFSAHRELLEPLIEFLEQRGRLPDDHEASGFTAIASEFGGLKRAFRLIVKVTGAEQWDVARAERSQDLLVYLALSRFGGRPRRGQLPIGLAADVRAFCGAYKKACLAADELLFQAGKREAIDAAFKASSVGKRTQSALYVHRRALANLPSVLRVFEGCARTLVGEVEGANVIKLYRDTPRVSYLGYPDFDSDPHPTLAGSLLVNLQSLQVSYRDYSESENPPILHRKEEFIMKDDPDNAAFADLTAQEEGVGLYADSASIGTRQAWNVRLQELGLKIMGHNVVSVRSGESDPAQSNWALDGPLTIP